MELYVGWEPLFQIFVGAVLCDTKSTLNSGFEPRSYNINISDRNFVMQAVQHLFVLPFSQFRRDLLDPSNIVCWSYLIKIGIGIE